MFDTRFLSSALFAAFMLMSNALSVAAQSTQTRPTQTRVVSYVGGPVPGLLPAARFSSYGIPSINNQGQVAFRANVVNCVHDFGVWSERTGSLAAVSVQAQAAPGTTDGAVFSSMNDPVINDAGHTAFRVYLVGGTVNPSNNFGIWSDIGGHLTKIAREGDAVAAELGGSTVLSIGDLPKISSSDRVAFVASLTGSDFEGGVGSGIISYTDGNVESVATSGQQAPGTSAGTTFAGFNPGIPVVGSNQLIFNGELNGAGVDGTHLNGIWTVNNGSTSLLVRQGDMAPGLSPSTTFKSFSKGQININGHAMFSAALDGTGYNSSNDNGIWTNRSGSLHLIVSEQQSAIGTSGDPVVIESFIERPILNNKDDIAYIANLEGFANLDHGIWVDRVSGTELIARMRDQAPGTVNGVVFNGFSDLSMNDNGQVLFRANLSGTSIDSINNAGYWATDTDGTLQLLVREGDVVDLDDDPDTELLKTIISVTSVSNASTAIGGGQRSFNNQGDFVFRAEFADGTEGILVASVPEPASLTLLIAGGAFLLKRRRVWPTG